MDENNKVKNCFQNEALVHQSSKFTWRMMCINMDEVRVLVKFFQQNVKKFRRGANVLLERIEDFEAVN